MTYVAYGYGRDSDRLGSVVTQGLGILFLLPVINASIVFDTNLGYEATKTLSADKNIDFNLMFNSKLYKFFDSSTDSNSTP